MASPRILGGFIVLMLFLAGIVGRAEAKCPPFPIGCSGRVNPQRWGKRSSTSSSSSLSSSSSDTVLIQHIRNAAQRLLHKNAERMTTIPTEEAEVRRKLSGILEKLRRNLNL